MSERLIYLQKMIANGVEVIGFPEGIPIVLRDGEMLAIRNQNGELFLLQEDKDAILRVNFPWIEP